MMAHMLLALSICVSAQEVDEAGFARADTRELQKSAKDVAGHLRKKFTIVEEGCAVRVEIIHRGDIIGAPVVTQHHGYGLTSKSEPRTPLVRLRVMVGEHEELFEGRGLPDNMFSGYGSAGKDAAKQAEKWLVANRNRLEK